MLEPDQVWELQRRGLEAFIGVLGASADGSQVLTFPGVVGAAVPAVPTRSMPNSVVYRSAADLSSALEALAARYRDLGIAAWTVWVPEGDERAKGLLEGSGHRLDASPAAMAMELGELADPELGDLDWDDEASVAEVGGINDLAYGWTGGDGFTSSLRRVPDPALRLFRARIDGEVACVAGTIDADEDCVLVMVATHPERRGAGLARRLCHAALAAARDRGLRTSTLQATKLGRPVYERLGYRTFGAIEMWERREPAER